MNTILQCAAICLLLSTSALGKDYQTTLLKDAHTLFRSATNSSMYAETAEQYEFLIHEEGIRNGELFYNAGNSWFMAGNLGRAVLNYRRAEQLIPGNKDLQHNLKSTKELRADLIPDKEPHPLAARFLGWHLHTSTAFRWFLFSMCWVLFWGAWFWMRRTAKKEPRIVVGLTGICSLVLLTSLVSEAIINQQSQPGVITAKEVIARKGDGNMYAPTFLEPLHAGTEFKQFDARGGWRHIELADGRTCWIPAQAAETVEF